jgi:excisionase family DNA binding protein
MSKAAKTRGVIMEPTYSELLNKPMLKVNETALVLGVNHKTIRDMVSKGELAHVCLGRTLRIPTHAVRTLLGI